MVREAREQRKKVSDIVTRDYTVHMSKRLYGVTFKKRAPRAIREIKLFAEKMMKTKCVDLSWNIFLVSNLILSMFEIKGMSVLIRH